MSTLNLWRRSPRPTRLTMILAGAILAAIVAGPTVALAMPQAQEAPAFILPTWFLGLIPAIAWFINSVLFKAIEKGRGSDLDSSAKRIIVVALCLLMSAGLVLSGSVELPAPIPGVPDPMLWGAWVVLLTGYVWAGATVIYAAIEAIKAVAGMEKPA